MVSVKAYGKILVFGSYSILEPGNVGLVLTTDKGTETTVKKIKTNEIRFNLKSFDKIFSMELSDNNIEIKEEIFLFIKNAVLYTLEYLGSLGKKISGLEISSINDSELTNNEIKKGMGSSATSTVSTVAAILKLYDIDNRDLTYKISRYSHYISQRGKGSGFDISAACYGSHFFISDEGIKEEFLEYVKKSVNKVEKFTLSSDFKLVMIFTNESASTTQRVSKINEFREKNFQQYDMFMKEYNKINLELRKVFHKNRIENIKNLLEESWKKRRELGKLARTDIENEKHTKLISQLKANGAYVAGLAGAGGGDSIVAFCLTEEDRKRLIAYSENKGMSVLNIKIEDNPYEFKQD